MIASTMLPLKILRTKKRLSNVVWYLPIIVLACMSLMILLSFMLRAISIAGIYGLVPLEMPVLSQPLDDPTYSRFREEARQQLEVQTPLIVLTPESFYFGELQAFTKDIANTRDKFIVHHNDGSPDLNKLLDDMEKWFLKQKSNNQNMSHGITILLPTGEIPAPILIQVIAGIQKSPLFDRIILAGGLD